MLIDSVKWPPLLVSTQLNLNRQFHVKMSMPISSNHRPKMVSSIAESVWRGDWTRDKTKNELEKSITGRKCKLNLFCDFPKNVMIRIYNYSISLNGIHIVTSTRDRDKKRYDFLLFVRSVCAKSMRWLTSRHVNITEYVDIAAVCGGCVTHDTAEKQQFIGFIFWQWQLPMYTKSHSNAEGFIV